VRFPGSRKSKHYFPSTDKERVRLDHDNDLANDTYIVGIDQLLVDIEAHVEDSFLSDFGIEKGESVVFKDDLVEEIYHILKIQNKIKGEYPGGAIGNTLHNYSILADDRSVAFGTICNQISVGDYAFKYVANTCSKIDLSYLTPVEGQMGRAFCLITPDGERSFVIGKGIMNQLPPEAIIEDVVAKSSGLLLSSYLLRDETCPMFNAALQAVKFAQNYNIPVVFSLGTSNLIEEKRDFFKDFIQKYVNIIACNNNELKALTKIEDPLLSAQETLDICDLILLTVGPSGLYLCGHADKDKLRVTKDKMHSKSIAEYNMYEYSRAMLKENCKNPVKIYSHINPYMGGPAEIKNTNGAGDAALSALLHDIASNQFHKLLVSNSSKHSSEFLTYSSIHQICKYSNRVSYAVLSCNSPRLSRGLPEKEDCLEESYWAL
jgi:inosine kinase